MEILVPVWPAHETARPPKTRPRLLTGAKIALVDDNLDIPFTTRLEALLGERHGAKVERLVKPSGTAPSPPDVIDTPAAAHAAIVGIGL
jgi:hypothetical protein